MQITRSLPRADERKSQALEDTRAEVIKASEIAEAASIDLGQIRTGKAPVTHAKGKWIGGAEKGIADAKPNGSVDPVKRYLHYKKAYPDGELVGEGKGFRGGNENLRPPGRDHYPHRRARQVQR